VTEVNTCFKQLLDCNFEHFMFLLGFFLHSGIIIRLAAASTGIIPTRRVRYLCCTSVAQS
jgi:hypothetical protein